MTTPEQARLAAEAQVIWRELQKIGDQRKLAGACALIAALITVGGIINPELGLQNWGAMGLSMIAVGAVVAALWWFDLRSKDTRLTRQWADLLQRQAELRDQD